MKEIIPMALRSIHIPKIKIIYHVISKIVQTCYFGYFGHAYLCPKKNDRIHFYKALLFISMQKNNFIPHLFPEILLRYYKYKFILGTLDVPAHTRQ